MIPWSQIAWTWLGFTFGFLCGCAWASPWR